jgi:ASC-1-like (ASCH) protein
MTHDLKIWPEYFDPLKDGRKRCEVRNNDRGFAVGDKLLLREWLPLSETYTGRKLVMRVTHILYGVQAGIRAGYVCMSVLRDEL